MSRGSHEFVDSPRMKFHIRSDVVNESSKSDPAIRLSVVLGQFFGSYGD